MEFFESLKLAFKSPNVSVVAIAWLLSISYLAIEGGVGKRVETAITMLGFGGPIVIWILAYSEIRKEVENKNPPTSNTKK